MTEPSRASASRVLGEARTVVRRVARSVTREVDAARRRVTSSPTTSDPFLQDVPPLHPTGLGAPTIVLLNDCRDQVNFGAEVLVDGLIRILRERVPDATIRPIPSHWLIDRRHLDAFVDGGAGLHLPKARYPEVADQFDAVADDWMQGRAGDGSAEVLARFDGADLVVLNGEGSIYRDNLSAIRELFLAWLAKQRLGIPTVHVNGLVHLTDVMPVLPAMVRRTFPVLDGVAVREAPSQRNVAHYVPGLEVDVFPDSAFVVEPNEAWASDAVRAVRERIGDQPYFCFDPGPMPIDARRGGRSALHRLVTALQSVAPRAVLVCSAPSDAYIEVVARETGAVYVDTIAQYREFMALVEGAQFLVSGRYHNPILAAIVGCPTIALASSSHKVHGTCEMLDDVLGSPYDGTALLPEIDGIVARGRSYADDRDAWRARMQEICERRRREAWGLGDFVVSALRVER
jgi:polysaccharide pyruvyl transferase WcaK-like protein